MHLRFDDELFLSSLGNCPGESGHDEAPSCDLQVTSFESFSTSSLVACKSVLNFSFSFLSLSIVFFHFALGFSNRNLTEIYTELELKNSATYSLEGHAQVYDGVTVASISLSNAHTHKQGRCEDTRKGRKETEISVRFTRFLDFRLMFDSGRSFNLKYDLIRPPY